MLITVLNYTQFTPRNPSFAPSLNFDYPMDRVNFGDSLIAKYLARLEFPMEDQQYLVLGNKIDIAITRCRMLHQGHMKGTVIFGCRVVEQMEREAAAEGNPLTRVYLEGFSCQGSMCMTDSRSYDAAEFARGLDNRVHPARYTSCTPGRFNGAVYETHPGNERFYNVPPEKQYPELPLLGWTDAHPKNRNLRRLVAVETPAVLEPGLFDKFTGAELQVFALNHKKRVRELAPNFLNRE